MEQTNVNAQRIIDTAITRIDSSSEAEIKDDMKKLVLAILKFLGEESPALLDKNNTGSEMGKIFFKMISSIALEGLTADFIPSARRKMVAKFQNLIELKPILDKYSNE